MPKARWWQYEDAQVDLGDIQRPNLNFLSMPLTEFGLLYSNDWFIIPVAQPVGSIKKVNSLNITDVFGELTKISGHTVPVSAQNEDNIFTLFTHEKGKLLDSSYLFLPNTLVHHIQGEPLEEVVFFRDEMANLVWAVERKYYDSNKSVVNREDEQFKPSPILTKRDRPLYDMMTPMPLHWIPYISVQTNQDSGQTIFRRARTIPGAKKGQFKSQLISDSTKIREEEISTTPIVLTQNMKMAVYDTEEWLLTLDGEGKKGTLQKKDQNTRKRLIWIGRKKNRGLPMPSSNLQFDYLIE